MIFRALNLFRLLDISVTVKLGLNLLLNIPSVE